MKRRWASTLSVVAFAAVLITQVALGAGPALASTASVGAADFSFSPKTITVHVGDTIVWTNHGPSLHTVTANSGAFDSGAIAVNGTFSHTFTVAGTVAYHCTFHVALGMAGTIVVLAPGQTGGGPLPNTGVSNRVATLAGLGVLLVVSGAALLLPARRRRTQAGTSAGGA
ncbi:MAG TPA: plastocyanin/azurin family copper-binding protein [Actinomycetota bacterium]